MAGASPSQVHPFVQLAIDAMNAYVCDFRFLAPPEGLLERFPVLRRRAGVFVSLKKRGELRGCIGTIEPQRDTLAVEIVENAISAASKDPRFRPVEEEELAELTVSVDILGEPERVAGPGDLDVRRYGVIVKAGARRGLLLPDIEGIASVDEQLSVARKKGGIGESEPVELYRFVVERYH
ncbi:MAG: AmmeMemoRadiSam system protein A [Nitrospirae bacterium]|nr:MAG: AmmeMemoRadiSam system protein A [Nitrospirota bacterium]